MIADNITMLRLKENLNQLIEAKGLTISSLGRLAKVPKQTLADWLAGAKPKDVTAVKRVSDALRVSIDALCFSNGEQGCEPIERYIDEINVGKFEVILRRPTK